MKEIQTLIKKPKKFILTLYEILHDESNSEIITWTETGQSFVIVDLSKFSSVILPQYFKHKNYSSFIRQLNMYDFHKIRDTGDTLIFQNRWFVRESPEKIMNVKRKIPCPATEKEKKVSEKVLGKTKKRYNYLKLKVKNLESKLNEIKTVNKMLIEQVGKFSVQESRIHEMIIRAQKMFWPYSGMNGFF